MYDPSNPYASPMSTQMSPVAAQWLGTTSPSLRKVATGLGMIYAGICLALITGIGGAVLLAVVARDVDTALTIGWLLMICIIISTVLNIVGTLFCLATPEESGAQGMVYASAAAMGINLLITLGTLVHVMPNGASALQQVLNIVSGVTFLIFLRRLSLFIGRPELAGKAYSILMWCIGLFVAMIATVVIAIGSVGLAFFEAAAGGQRAAMANNAAGGAGLAVLLMFIIAIAALITFLRYANLLTYIRKAILSGGQG